MQDDKIIRLLHVVLIKSKKRYLTSAKMSKHKTQTVNYIIHVY